EQAPGKPLYDRQVDATAEHRADAITRIQSAYRQTVIADQGVDKGIRSLTAPDEARSGRTGSLVVRASPVVPKIELEPPVRVEIVGQARAEPFGHGRNLEAGGIVRVSEWSRNRTTGIQVLISHKEVPLGIRVTLRERGTRDQHQCQDRKQDRER